MIWTRVDSEFVKRYSLNDYYFADERMYYVTDLNEYTIILFIETNSDISYTTIFKGEKTYDAYEYRNDENVIDYIYSENNLEATLEKLHRMLISRGVKR